MSQKFNNEVIEMNETNEIKNVTAPTHVYTISALPPALKKEQFLIKTDDYPANFSVYIRGVDTLDINLSKKPTITTRGKEMLSNHIDDNDSVPASVKIYKESVGSSTIPWIEKFITKTDTQTSLQVILKPNSEYLFEFSPLAAAGSGSVLIEFRWTEKKIK